MKKYKKTKEQHEVPYWKQRRLCPKCGRELPYFPFDECKFCGWTKICPNCHSELEQPYSKCDLCGWRKKEISKTIPKHVQREVWRRDQGRCVECGSKERLEFDHIIPFSKGGSNTARNIQLLCENCNRKKSNTI